VVWLPPHSCMATATQLYGYRHTVVWLPPHSCMATATQLYGDRHTVGWLPPVAFSYLVVKSAPSGKDWINGGTGRTKLEAISIATKIAQKIPKGKDFEVYVDYHDDGSFTVYYRLVK
ncbi:MAG: hypothetical protein PUI88_05040, partial [Prevotella sp.]|nr:hypothetical protein [Prevotella sp.]